MKNQAEQESQFSQMVDARLSRRRFLTGTAAVGAGAFYLLTQLLKCLQITRKAYY